MQIGHDRGMALRSRISERAALAAYNNASWCAAVWRAHGLPVAQAEGLWFCAARTPAFYPTAVTVDPAADPARQAAFVADLARRLPGLELAVKDSFARLELGGAGFVPLFEASWLWREPGGPRQAGGLTEVDRALAWRRLAEERSLAAWELAWRGEASAERIFRPALLADRRMAVLAGLDAAGAIRAGGIAYDAGGAWGITNLFGPRRGVVAALARLAGACPLVCYERAETAREERRHGFTAVGPLRVWTRPAAPAPALPAP
jgi:hypothetical protein